MSCQQVPTAPAFNPYPRSVQVGEFEVAIGGGIWVAIGEQEVQLQPVDGKLEAAGNFKVASGTKAVVAVSKVGKAVASVRFTLK